MAGWLAPPTRRELTITLLGLFMFISSYNLSSAFKALDGHSHHASHLAKPVSTNAVDKNSPKAHELGKQLDDDGRRLPEYRDALEDQIYGRWAWRVGAVADTEGRKPVGEGERYMEGAVWGWQINASAPRAQESVAEEGMDEMRRGWAAAGTNAGQVVWEDGKDVKETVVRMHVPGYTILDNVVVQEGVLYVVTDKPTEVPKLDQIISHNGQHDVPANADDIRVISTADARTKFGTTGTIFHGTSWMVTGASSFQDSHTLLSLLRLQASLTSPPPLRLIFPHISTYTTFIKDEKEQLPPFSPAVLPARSYTGIPPSLLKALLPSLNPQHQEDWNDLSILPRPFVFARLMLVDRGAASRGDGSIPPWSGPLLKLPASPPSEWLEPYKQTLHQHLNTPNTPHKSIVYISSQDQSMPSGPKLRAADHAALVSALHKSGASHSYSVYEVNEKTPFGERMRAVLRASVLLGVGGHSALAGDGAFLSGPHSSSKSHATVVEVWPADVWMADTAISAAAVGVGYVALQEGKVYKGEERPKQAPPRDFVGWMGREVKVDVGRVVREVEGIIRRV